MSDRFPDLKLPSLKDKFEARAVKTTKRTKKVKVKGRAIKRKKKSKK